MADAFTVTDARDYVAKVRWRFAKTMPKWPHEYTVREWRPELDAEFEAFCELIRREGVRKPWPRDAVRPRYRHAYLEIDGWEYWSMEKRPCSAAPLINRARVDEPGPL